MRRVLVAGVVGLISAAVMALLLILYQKGRYPAMAYRNFVRPRYMDMHTKTII